MFSKSNLKVSRPFKLTKYFMNVKKIMHKLGLYWHFVLSAWFVLRFESDFLSVNSGCGCVGVLVSFNVHIYNLDYLKIYLFFHFR